MAKQNGLGDGFIIGGYYIPNDISAVTRISGGPALGENTGIDKSAMERWALNRDGGIDFTAYFNDATDRAHAILKTLPRTDTLVTYLRSTILGAPSAVCNALQNNYDGNRGADGSLPFSVVSNANGYGLEWGIQLTAGQRTDTAATNGTSVDGAASSAFGAQAYLQYQSVVGTSVTVTIEDSADNVSFAAITGLAFTAVAGAAAPGFQRLATTNTATIRRYVRAVTAGTFSSAVFQVTFNRNESAGVVF